MAIGPRIPAPTPKPYSYTTDEAARFLDHADHNVEEWHAYVCDTSDAPDYVDGNSSGLCCHDCRLVVVSVA